MASSSSTVARSRQTHSSLHPDDAMALRAAELSAWARKNARMIIGIAAVALVVVGGLLVWKYSQAQRRAAAAERFLALASNPAMTTAAGARQIETFIRQYDGTTEADEARLMLAQEKMNGGTPREALPHLTRVASSRSPVAAQAAMMLGSAYAQLGQRAQAVAAYEQAAEKSSAQYQEFEALGQAALQHEQAGDNAAAVAIYQRMLAETEPNSPQATVIQMRMTEAQARAANR
jgi:predicted negative regulator of RcsB-dependent stress response